MVTDVKVTKDKYDENEKRLIRSGYYKCHKTYLDDSTYKKLTIKEKKYYLDYKEPFLFSELFWNIIISGIIVGGIMIWVFFGWFIPNNKYSNATPYEKCQLDLKKAQDDDKYCDINNKIQSKKANAESKAKLDEDARKASLSPKQRCEEEHKSFSDEDGEYYSVICKDDGTYSVESFRETMEETQDELNQSNSNDCNPNYTPCIPNGYDLDCPDIGFTVTVVGYDEYRLDRDGDGYGCE